MDKTVVCTTQPDGSELCITQTAPTCVPPLIWKCPAGPSYPQLCSCQPFIQRCTLTISYPANDATQATVSDVSPGCDSPELALALILAGLLAR